MGQNLALGYGEWSHVIQAWFDEQKDFTYATKKDKLFKDVGHYTQVIDTNGALVTSMPHGRLCHVTCVIESVAQMLCHLVTIPVNANSTCHAENTGDSIFF